MAQIKRTSKIIIAVTEKEKTTIRENAKNAQLTVSEYLRTMAIYKEIK